MALDDRTKLGLWMVIMEMSQKIWCVDGGLKCSRRNRFIPMQHETIFVSLRTELLLSSSRRDGRVGHLYGKLPDAIWAALRWLSSHGYYELIVYFVWVCVCEERESVCTHVCVLSTLSPPFAIQRARGVKDSWRIIWFCVQIERPHSQERDLFVFVCVCVRTSVCVCKGSIRASSCLSVTLGEEKKQKPCGHSNSIMLPLIIFACQCDLTTLTQ